MAVNEAYRKGGSNAAFFLLLLVAIVDTGKLFPLRLGILRLAVFASAAWFLWRSREEPAESGGYALAIAGFVFLSLGHAFSSVYFWVSMQHALNIAMAALILLWAYRSVRRDPDAAWEGVFFAVCSVAAVQFAVALYQRLSAGNMRPRGTFDNTNFFAEFMAVAAILCLSRCIGKEERKWGRIAGAAGALLFSFAAFGLSASRAVLVAAVPAVAVLLLSLFGWRRGGKWLLAGGLPVLALLGVRVAERFASPDPYNYARLVLWESAGRTFLANPFGVGLGGFKFFWYSTQGPVEGAFMRYGKFSTTAHNEFLEVLSGLGVAGLVLFALALFVPLFLVWRRFAGVEGGRRWAVAGATCALIVSGVHAMVDFNFHEMGLVVLDAVLLGAVLASLPESERGFRITVPPWGKGAGIAAVALLFAISAATLAGKAAHAAGKRSLRAGNAAGAERLFRAAMAVDPFCDAYPDAMAALRHGMYAAARKTGDAGRDGAERFLAESIRWEGEALALSPMDFLKTKRLSFLLEEMHALSGRSADLDAAIRAADRAIEINPYSAETLWKRADLLGRAGRTKEAVADLVHAVSVEPNFCRGYAGLAIATGPTDRAGASRWEEREKECRQRAKTIRLEDHEMWMVEAPGE